ncbi:MAG: GWxTD domain-containing protein [Candidatus Cloacimonadota bacterium]|nr:GWxTD domain-containing protein [Candidatus Cloacimonadota bacterium]
MKVFLLIVVGYLMIWMPAETEESDFSAEQNQVFDNIEDEFNLAKYFFSSPMKNFSKDLDDEDKSVFLKRFWKNRDPNPVTEKNEFLDEITRRVEYANTHFSHYQDGWTTARGRIYIKHGAPYEIINERTGINTKYTQKEYQIWKYHLQNNLTYIFLDLGGYGDYRLIYSGNDDNEVTLPNWRSYLGDSFKEEFLY